MRLVGGTLSGAEGWKQPRFYFYTARQVTERTPTKSPINRGNSTNTHLYIAKISLFKVEKQTNTRSMPKPWFVLLAIFTDSPRDHRHSIFARLCVCPSAKNGGNKQTLDVNEKLMMCSQTFYSEANSMLSRPRRHVTCHPCM